MDSHGVSSENAITKYVSQYQSCQVLLFDDPEFNPPVQRPHLVVGSPYDLPYHGRIVRGCITSLIYLFLLHNNPLHCSITNLQVNLQILLLQGCNVHSPTVDPSFH